MPFWSDIFVGTTEMTYNALVLDQSAVRALRNKRSGMMLLDSDGSG
jgi:hypothetical protein